MSAEHDCYNCRYAETPHNKPPCVTCLEYGTRYPCWNPQIDTDIFSQQEAVLNNLKNQKLTGL